MGAGAATAGVLLATLDCATGSLAADRPHGWPWGTFANAVASSGDASWTKKTLARAKPSTPKDADWMVYSAAADPAALRRTLRGDAGEGACVASDICAHGLLRAAHPSGYAAALRRHADSDRSGHVHAALIAAISAAQPARAKSETYGFIQRFPWNKTCTMELVHRLAASGALSDAELVEIVTVMEEKGVPISVYVEEVEAELEVEAGAQTEIDIEAQAQAQAQAQTQVQVQAQGETK